MEKTALVADDDFEMAQSLCMRLKQLGFKVMRSPDATHALVGAQRLHPDLIILDVNMPGGNGLAAAEMLAGDIDMGRIPLIIHTGCIDDLTRARCKHLGLHYVQKSPQSWKVINAWVCDEFNIVVEQAQPNDAVAQKLESIATEGGSPCPPEATSDHPRFDSQRDFQDNGRIRQQVEPDARSWAHIRAMTCSALEIESDLEQTSDPVPRPEVRLEPSGMVATPEPLQTSPSVQNPGENEGCGVTILGAKRATVLCIDDDPDISAILKLRLAEYGVDVARAFSGTQGFWTALDSRPDVIVCDMTMPDGDGNYIFSRLKSHPLTENTPVIFLTGQANPAIKRIMVSNGAAAYLNKPLVFDHLLTELRVFLELPEKSIAGAASARLVAR